MKKITLLLLFSLFSTTVKPSVPLKYKLLTLAEMTALSAGSAGAVHLWQNIKHYDKKIEFLKSIERYLGEETKSLTKEEVLELARQLERSEVLNEIIRKDETLKSVTVKRNLCIAALIADLLMCGAIILKNVIWTGVPAILDASKTIKEKVEEGFSKISPKSPEVKMKENVWEKLNTDHRIRPESQTFTVEKIIDSRNPEVIYPPSNQEIDVKIDPFGDD